MDCNDEEISMPCRSPKNLTASQDLRRSSRKRSILDATTSSTTPSVKKSMKIPYFLYPPVPTLTTLPEVVTTKLLLYLDVETLENLSLSCSFFEQMIAGRFLTSINFPFTVDVIYKLLSTDCVEKKPLLKLKCKKSKEQFKVFPDNFF